MQPNSQSKPGSNIDGISSAPKFDGDSTSPKSIEVNTPDSVSSDPLPSLTPEASSTVTPTSSTPDVPDLPKLPDIPEKMEDELKKEDSTTEPPKTPDEPKPVLPNAKTGGGGHRGGSFSSLTVILTVLLLIVIVGGVYIVYYWEHKQINNLNAQVTSLNKEVTSLQSQVNSSGGTSSTSTGSNTFTISQLGIQFTIPTVLEDLTYAANTAGDTVNLSTQTLTTLDSACSANATTGSALGNLSKANGQFPTTSKTMTLVKQFSTYYIAYTKPATACSTNSSVTNLLTVLTTDLKDSFSSISATS